VAELVRALAGEIPHDRQEAAQALGAKGAEALPAIRKALKDKDWRVRRGATDALAQIGADAKSEMPALVEALKDKDAWVRDGAAVALGKIGRDAKDAAKALAKAATDESVWVRESAMGALRSVTTDKDILLPAATAAVKIRESGWAAKRHAFAVLWQHGKQYKPAIPALLAMLEDRPEGMWDSTQRAVELLIGMDAGDKAVPALIEMLKTKFRGRPSLAARLLGKLGAAARPAIPALKAAAKKHPYERVRAAAKEALEQIAQAKPAASTKPTKPAKPAKPTK
jgi:HEAT repeat protein